MTNVDISYPKWYASLHADSGNEETARKLSAWLRCSNGTTLRTLGDIVDHLTKLERRCALMDGVITVQRKQLLQHRGE